MRTSPSGGKSPSSTPLLAGENRTHGLPQVQLTIPFTSGSSRIPTENADTRKGLLRPLVSSQPHWGLENLQPGASAWPGQQPCPLIPLASPTNCRSPGSSILSEDTKGPGISQGSRTGCMQEVLRVSSTLCALRQAHKEPGTLRSGLVPVLPSTSSVT